MPAFDIFRLQQDGILLWCDAVASLELAKLRVQSLSVSSPGRYVILSQNAGNKTILQAEPPSPPSNAQ